MNITVYDGAESIGGNKIYVEENGRGVFLDFGMNFARYGEYYAEFLSDRSTRGIHDPLYLGFIPKLNIYRSDLIPSDVDLSGYPQTECRGNPAQPRPPRPLRECRLFAGKYTSCRISNNPRNS